MCREHPARTARPAVTGLNCSIHCWWCMGFWWVCAPGAQMLLRTCSSSVDSGIPGCQCGRNSSKRHWEVHAPVCGHKSVDVRLTMCLLQSFCGRWKWQPTATGSSIYGEVPWSAWLCQKPVDVSWLCCSGITARRASATLGVAPQHALARRYICWSCSANIQLASVGHAVLNALRRRLLPLEWQPTMGCAKR